MSEKNQGDWERTKPLSVEDFSEAVGTYVHKAADEENFPDYTVSIKYENSAVLDLSSFDGVAGDAITIEDLSQYNNSQEVAHAIKSIAEDMDEGEVRGFEILDVRGDLRIARVKKYVELSHLSCG